MEDPSNSLFLHHSNGLGLVLISQPLTKSNYNTWSYVVIVALFVKNKLAFIDGFLPKPDGIDP
ncbi:Gag-polypeptide of LTR copia-type [Sesbania bispinosa]|nr:Gag-polypeptide of LTR copia-type [Sesbania bispinosa]